MFKKILKETLIGGIIFDVVICIVDGNLGEFFGCLGVSCLAVFLPILIYNLVKEKMKEEKNDSVLKNKKILIPTIIIAVILGINLDFENTSSENTSSEDRASETILHSSIRTGTPSADNISCDYRGRNKEDNEYFIYYCTFRYLDGSVYKSDSTCVQCKKFPQLDYPTCVSSRSSCQYIK